MTADYIVASRDWPITDEQIRALRDEMNLIKNESDGAMRLFQECESALNLPNGFDRQWYRIRVAKVIRARTQGVEVQP